MFKRKKEEEEKQEVKKAEAINTNYFDLFGAFEKISNIRNIVDVVEISLRQGQFMILFKPQIIPLDVLESFSKEIRRQDNGIAPTYCSITFINENPALVINTNKFKSDQFEFGDTFQVLYDTIHYAADNICKCPALEIVFSNQYIKCYLDKPGLTLDDVSKYEVMFRCKGTLELFGQRPYLLLINDVFEE